MSFAIGESVHIPSSKLGTAEDYPYSMTSSTVREVADRAVKVDLRDGTLSPDIPLSVVRKKLGILIVEVGDYKSEETLLTPLKKSILQFSRLLLNDDFIKNFTIRTPDELKHIWNEQQAIVSHLVLVGHGDVNSILFGAGKSVEAQEFLDLLAIPQNVGEAKQVISLCCKTGSKTFGGMISGNPKIEAFIGPSGAVHGANASQFYQSYLTYHFLHGYKSSTAYEYAKVSNPGASDFTFWRKKQAFTPRNGQLRIARDQSNN